MVLKSLISKLSAGIAKTKEGFTKRVRDLFSVFRKIDDAFLDQLEETLLSADMGIETVQKIRQDLQKAYKEGLIETSDKVLDYLKNDLKQLLRSDAHQLQLSSTPPTIILVAGVNGTGKTTSIAKLANLLHLEGKKVLLAASDTFRAAAIEQLTVWSQRVGVEIIKHQHGADPAAVAYDGAEAAVSRKMDVLIIDTAGRLQTKTNLMKELTKIKNVLSKRIPGAPHEVLLVLDATTGQNAISQAIHFKEAGDVTGIFLAKLDGTAKGGIVVAIKDKLNIPVKFVGLGEQLDDIARFDADSFVEALFQE